jgi:hypothetical protein
MRRRSVVLIFSRCITFFLLLDIAPASASGPKPAGLPLLMRVAPKRAGLPLLMPIAPRRASVSARTSTFAATQGCVVPQPDLNQTVVLDEDAGGYEQDVPGTYLVNHHVTIDWGDGTVQSYLDQVVYLHRYAQPGQYVVTFSDTGLIGFVGEPPSECSTFFNFVVTVIPLPVLHVSDEALFEGDTGTTAFQFAVTLSYPRATPVSVFYQTVNGSANASSDYEATSGTLVFSPGETVKDIAVNVVGDVTVESDEEFSVMISSATGATIGNATGVGTIRNDDIPPTASFKFLVHPGGRVEFDASASGAGQVGASISGYEWSFGDGTEVSTLVPTVDHNYTELKDFTVTLVVTDSNGNESSPVSNSLDVCSPDVPAVNAREYASLVACVETKLPTQSPRQILSTMRKLYFGSESWSNSPRSQWDDVIPCGLPVPNPRPLLSAKLYAALVALNSSPPAEGDLSHLFAGLEAMECPSNAVQLTPLTVAGYGIGWWKVDMPNYDFATWGGDVGSAVALKSLQDVNGNVLDWSHYIGPEDTRTSFSDLEGDLDALVLGYATSGQDCAAAPQPPVLVEPLSKIIESYYSDQSSALAQYHLNRVECFAEILGVQSTAGVNVQKLQARYASKLYDLAVPYFLIQRGGSAAVRQSVRNVIKANATAAAGIFAAWLNTR